MNNELNIGDVVLVKYNEIGKLNCPDSMLVDNMLCRIMSKIKFADCFRYSMCPVREGDMQLYTSSGISRSYSWAVISKYADFIKVGDLGYEY